MVEVSTSVGLWDGLLRLADGTVESSTSVSTMKRFSRPAEASEEDIALQAVGQIRWTD